jgi:hypothetical protein
MFGKGKKVVGRKYLDDIGEYIDAHKKDATIKLVLVVIIVILTLGYFRLSRNIEMTLEIPPILRETGTLKVGYQEANDLYFKVWGQYFVDEYTSLDHKNASKKLNKLLAMIEAKKAVLYQPKLEKKANYIISNKINQRYTHSDEYIESKIQDGYTIFHSEGLLEERIGRVSIKKSCEYNIGMRVQDHSLLFGLISENCKKIGNIE